MNTALLERPDTWEWEDPMAEGEDRPLVVGIPITKLLDDIRMGVDKANDSLALKADRSDITALHQRIDGVLHDQREVNDRVAAELSTQRSGLARLNGWRAGFLVACGMLGGLVVSLVLRATGA